METSNNFFVRVRLYFTDYHNKFMFTAVEKKNDVCNYFKLSNKKNPTKDIVNHEQKGKNLRCFARREFPHISTNFIYIYYIPERQRVAVNRREEQFDLSITSIMHSYIHDYTSICWNLG